MSSIKFLVMVSDRKKKIAKFCITRRQWALLLSINYLIIFFLLTVAGVLATRHNNEVLDLLKEDYFREKFRHSEVHPITANEAKLQESQNNLQKVTPVLAFYMWLAYLKFVSSAILCVGVGLKNPALILQWTFFSFFVFFTATNVIAFSYFQVIPAYYCNVFLLAIYLIVTPIWLITWYFMIYYYSEVKRIRGIMDTDMCIAKAAVARAYAKGKVTKSYGDLVHQVQFNPI